MKTHLILTITLFILYGFLSAQDNKASVLLAAAVYEEEVTGNLDKAAGLYLDILKKYPDDRPVAAKTLYHLGLVNEKMGRQKAGDYFSRLVNTYPDQTDFVKLAKARLTVLEGSGSIGRTEASMRRVWVAGNNHPVGISPDGRYVVFGPSGYGGPSGSGDLWLRDIGSGEQKRITRDGSWMESTFASGSAAISPDGKQIAYDWYVRGNGGLRLSALDGSSMRVLCSGQDGRSMNVSAWMPDGRKILAVSYDRRDNTYRRHIISLPDGTVRDIGQPEPENVNLGNMHWGYPSPDGQYIAYGLKGDIFVFDTKTEKDSVLVKNPVVDKVIGWTPDGSGIVFVSNRSGTRDLYLLEIRNGQSLGEPQLLQRNIGDAGNLCMTRDGRLFRIDNMGTADSFIVPVDEKSGKPTGLPTPVDATYPGVWFPAWSSDGNLLYYTIRFQELVICSEATGETRKITPKTILSWYRPILSPDGRRFAVSGTGENHNFGLFAIDSESGDVSQLAKIPTEIEPIDPIQNWSPDGKAIYYKVRSPEKREEFIIRRIDLTTGEEKEIHRGIHIRNMQISPDGTRFVYFWNDRLANSYGLGILYIQSGKKLELWRVPEADAPTGIVAYSWTPDGRYVLVARNLGRGTELWRFPATGGPGEKLHFFPEQSWGFVMHPGGKRMAFTQNRTNYELWMMENFLPKEKINANVSTMTVTRAWEKEDVTGKVSADGRFLSFTDWETTDISIHDLATGQNRRLTDNRCPHCAIENSVPSNDSRSIAYTLYSNSSVDLCIVGVDGLKPHVLKSAGNGVLNYIPLAWSPDSKRLLAEFIKTDGSRDMMLVTVADGSTKLLKSTGKDLSPGGVFSPDGKYIAWSTREGISLFDLRLGSESPLLQDLSKHAVLGWAPDGKYLMFSSERSGSSDAWLIAMAGGKAQGEPIFVKKEWGFEPMGFTRSGAFYYSVNNNVWDVKIAEFDPAGKNAVSLPKSAFRHGNMRGPDWSPDGRFLAGIVATEPSQAVIIRSLDTGEERELRTGGWTIGMGSLRWTPNGKAVVAPASEAGKGEYLIQIDTQTGKVTPLMPLPALGGWPRFAYSKDGNLIYYARPDPSDMNKSRLVAHDLRSGEETVIRENSGILMGNVSPDGGQLLIAKSLENGKSAALYIMPVSGGEPRELVKVDSDKEVFFWGSASWTQDGRYVIFLKGIKKEEPVDYKKLEWQLWRVATEGGEVQPLGLKFRGQLAGPLRLHPDGRRVVVGDVRVNLEVWVMENFLPK